MFEILHSVESDCVADAFKASRALRGYLAPTDIAAHIGTPGTSLHSDAYNTTLYFPTRNSLFPGALHTIEKILQNGDLVAIWTDEYTERIQSSGLQGLQNHGDFSIICGEQKQQEIPRIFELARSRRVDEIVIIDDHALNLEAVQEHAINYPDIALTPIQLRHRRSARESTVFPVISHVRKAERIARRRANHSGKRLYVFDFNGTLLNTLIYEERLKNRLVQVMKCERKGWDSVKNSQQKCVFSKMPYLNLI